MDILALTTPKALVKFTAPWCKPCGALSTTIDRLVIPFPIITVDIDQFPEIAQQYQVRSVPTIAIMENGIVVRSLVGNQTPPSVQAFVNA